jgi:hypothetical protein
MLYESVIKENSKYIIKKLLNGKYYQIATYPANYKSDDNKK